MQNFFPVGFFKTAHISTLFVTKKKMYVNKKIMLGILKTPLYLFHQYLLFQTKGQLNSEWIYEVIVSPKMQT